MGNAINCKLSNMRVACLLLLINVVRGNDALPESLSRLPLFATTAYSSERASASSEGTKPGSLNLESLTEPSPSPTPAPTATPISRDEYYSATPISRDEYYANLRAPLASSRGLLFFNN